MPAYQSVTSAERTVLCAAMKEVTVLTLASPLRELYEIPKDLQYRVGDALQNGYTRVRVFHKGHGHGQWVAIGEASFSSAWVFPPSPKNLLWGYTALAPAVPPFTWRNFFNKLRPFAPFVIIVMGAGVIGSYRWGRIDLVLYAICLSLFTAMAPFARSMLSRSKLRRAIKALERQAPPKAPLNRGPSSHAA
jgi:hypothetical protein